jgi:hypothetical protein
VFTKGARSVVRASTFLRRFFARPSSRMSVSSNSVIVITPGTDSSNTSTVVVSTTGAIGGFVRLNFFRASFFAPGPLALATPFFIALVEVRLAALPCADLEDYRALLTYFFVGSLLDLVEVAAVGIGRVVGLFVRPVTHNGIFAALLLGQEAKQQHNETESHKDDDQFDHVRKCAQQAG